MTSIDKHFSSIFLPTSLHETNGAEKLIKTTSDQVSQILDGFEKKSSFLDTNISDLSDISREKKYLRIDVEDTTTKEVQSIFRISSGGTLHKHILDSFFKEKESHPSFKIDSVGGGFVEYDESSNTIYLR